MKKRTQDLLAEIGFSGLEASVYLALLEEPGATGYRLSRMVGKPAANTYKALDSLRRKGAVVEDETTGTRSYAALPIGEYLETMRRDLEARRSALEEELRDLGSPPPEGGLFKLADVDQVYTRVKKILDESRFVVLLDVFPAPLEELQADIARTAKRGVSVFIKAYRPAKIKGCDVIAPEQGDAPDMKIWNGDWLNITADGRESVIAFMKPGRAGVNEAVWSRNPYLSLMIGNGMFHELMLTRIVQMLRRNMTRAEIAPEVNRLARTYGGVRPWREILPKHWLKEWHACESEGGGKRRKRASRPKRGGKHG